MIHLDTNAAIALLNGRPPAVRLRFDEARSAGRSMALSVVVFHELMYGAAASERRRENENRIALLLADGGLALVPLDEADSADAAELRAYLKKAATPIGPYDLLIAAQARRRGATLVTANTREFIRVPGLLVADWSA